MKVIISIFIFCFIHISCLFAQDSIVAKYSKTITEQELSDHVFKLASGDMGGRFTGSEGMAMAQDYITREFQGSGLEMPVIAGQETYLQEFSLNNCRWKDQRLAVNGEGLKVGKDFLFMEDPIDIHGTFQVVFAGFGVDDKSYSDFGDLDLTGKIMLVFHGEPMNEEGISQISGTRYLSKKGYHFHKVAEASSRGAEGAIVITDKRSGFGEYTKYKDNNDQKPNLLYPLPDPEEKIRRNTFLAYMHIKSAAKIVGETPKSLKKARNDMEKDFKPMPGRFTGSVEIDAESECSELRTSNIIAIVEGTDLKHEAVVVTAHYDHLGGSGEDIYHGADDNASGTAALMEIAEAFALAAAEGFHPDRTVIFMAVTAEELGLYGSRYYSENPLVSLHNTIACVNIDMIGRAAPKWSDSSDYVYGFAYVSPDILAVASEGVSLAAPELQNRMEYRNSVRAGSDHYYFVRNGIPSLFYFTGFHSDYHETTDTPEKILYGRMEKITRAIFAATWELANREEELKVEN